MTGQNKPTNRMEDIESDLEEQDGAKEEDDEFSIFNIEIAQILWRRNRRNSEEPEYLIKYRGRSYLHTEWLTEEEINSLGKNMRNKINRFNKAHNEKLLNLNYDEEAIDDEVYFDASYLEVDRIISSTEMFPIIHQKKVPIF